MGTPLRQARRLEQPIRYCVHSLDLRCVVSPDRFCKIDRAVEIMKKAEKEFDSLILEAYRLCRLCVTC